jgi:hypothetical protein
VSNCPKCNAVVKGWDLVCPSCGATLFTPQAPADERKQNVDLPDWEMSPKKPEPVRKPPPPRPDPRKPVPARPAGPPSAHRIEVPSLPRPPLAQEPVLVEELDESTDKLSIDEIQPIETPQQPPLPAARPPQPAAPPVALADIRPSAPTAPAMDEAPATAPAVQPPSPAAVAPVQQPAPAEPSRGQLRRRSRQDTMPIARFEEEVTQPRAKVPRAAAAPIPDQPRIAEPVPDALEKASAKETLNVENYDPERLKRILEQAQAEAGVRAARKKQVPLSVIVALIVAVTIIGVALVIALLA